jgi:hypothetical protein
MIEERIMDKRKSRARRRRGLEMRPGEPMARPVTPGHGSPLNYYVPGLCVLPGWRDTPDHLGFSPRLAREAPGRVGDPPDRQSSASAVVDVDRHAELHPVVDRQ